MPRGRKTVSKSAWSCRFKPRGTDSEVALVRNTFPQKLLFLSLRAADEGETMARRIAARRAEWRRITSDSHSSSWTLSKSAFHFFDTQKMDAASLASNRRNAHDEVKDVPHGAQTLKSENKRGCSASLGAAPDPPSPSRCHCDAATFQEPTMTLLLSHWQPESAAKLQCEPVE